MHSLLAPRSSTDAHCPLGWQAQLFAQLMFNSNPSFSNQCVPSWMINFKNLRRTVEQPSTTRLASKQWVIKIVPAHHDCCFSVCTELQNHRLLTMCASNVVFHQPATVRQTKQTAQHTMFCPNATCKHTVWKIRWCQVADELLESSTNRACWWFWHDISCWSCPCWQMCSGNLHINDLQLRWTQLRILEEVKGWGCFLVWSKKFRLFHSTFAPSTVRLGSGLGFL